MTAAVCTVLALAGLPQRPLQPASALSRPRIAPPVLAGGRDAADTDVLDVARRAVRTNLPLSAKGMMSRKAFKAAVPGPEAAADVVFDALAGSGANLVTRDRLNAVLPRLLDGAGEVVAEALAREYRGARLAYYGAYAGFTAFQGSFYYCIPFGWLLQESFGIDYRILAPGGSGHGCAALCQALGAEVGQDLAVPIALAAFVAAFGMGAYVTQSLINGSTRPE